MNIIDLDKLKTKQDFLRPLKLTKEQEIILAKATETEREQFKNKPVLKKEDLPKLTEVKSTQNIYLAKTIENPYVTIEMKNTLDEIETRFKEKYSEGLIIIISVTRTQEEELQTNPQISKDSTHMKGEAVDFAGKFMRENFSESARVLEEILNEMKEESKIHFLDEEDSTAFWHVARNLV